ncbi:hypothetical protein [Sinomonas mesophila]|uniref:hypothetical protein n=1 Tax=Sinomonas mesophila TaxID=1531955 RepID=UPI00098736FA|nr:hypothetical protein [Sinomonas mesophila]
MLQAVAAAALIALGVVGGVALRPPVESSSEYAALGAELAAATSESSRQADTIAGYVRQESAMKAREAAAAAKENGFAQREQEAAKREQDVTKKEADLTAREKAFEERQTKVAQSQITDGLHVVGKDVQPGVYSTTGGSGRNPLGCYYAWMSGTGSDAEIVDNNIVKGPATVTLRDGEVFESSSCAPWTKQG